MTAHKIAGGRNVWFTRRWVSRILATVWGLGWEVKVRGQCRCCCPSRCSVLTVDIFLAALEGSTPSVSDISGEVDVCRMLTLTACSGRQRRRKHAVPSSNGSVFVRVIYWKQLRTIATFCQFLGSRLHTCHGSLHLPPLPFPFPFTRLFPAPLELESPLIQLGLEERCKLLQRPQRKSNLVHFSLKIWH